MRRCSPHCGSGGSRAGAEQQVVDLRLQLVEERNQDLTGARAANRELMARLNAAERHLSRSLPSIHQLLSCADARLRPPLHGPTPGEQAGG